MLEHLGPRSPISRPFHALDHGDDNVLLEWLNTQYIEHIQGCDSRIRIARQTEALALYLNLIPEDSYKLAAVTADSLSFIAERRHQPALVTHITDIINSLVARHSVRDTKFNVFPQNEQDISDRARAKMVRFFLNAMGQTQDFERLRRQLLYHSFIFGEGYLEVYWDPDKGPQAPEIQKLLEEEGPDALADLPDNAAGLRIGETCSNIIDPRNLIVQPHDTFQKAEWVIILEPKPTESLQMLHEDMADKIQPTEDFLLFKAGGLELERQEETTMVMRMYHKATPFMPGGFYMEATPECVLKKGPMPYHQFIEWGTLPVIQLPDVEIYGSSRGYAGSAMENIKITYIALNKAWAQALKNLQHMSPQMWVQHGSVDTSKMRTGDRSIRYYRRGYEKPMILSQEVISQGHQILIERLTNRLMQLANVFPLSRGETIPNTESREMQDFFKEQELEQSRPKDEAVMRFLETWGRYVLAISAQYYTDEDLRSVQYFGKLKSHAREPLKVHDLQADVDVVIEPGIARASSLNGRLQQLQSLMSVAPELLSPAERVDFLEVGSPTRLYDSMTNTVDRAEEDLDTLLSGGEVPSPQKYSDLLTYYDTFMKAIQKPSIYKLLPEQHSPGGGKSVQDQIGNRILDQIATVEDLLLQTLEEIVMQDPQTGQTLVKGDLPTGANGITLKQMIYGKYPTFPSVFKRDIKETINPLDIAQEAIPETLEPEGMGGGEAPPSSETMLP